MKLCLADYTHKHTRHAEEVHSKGNLGNGLGGCFYWVFSSEPEMIDSFAVDCVSVSPPSLKGKSK
jgi:hypothetical protein